MTRLLNQNTPINYSKKDNKISKNKHKKHLPKTVNAVKIDRIGIYSVKP